MATIIDKITITDKKGFTWPVHIEHHPNLGVSIAFYDGSRITSREYGKMHSPAGDDDREWEEWEERFREWADAAIEDLKLACKEYFDKPMK